MKLQRGTRSPRSIAGHSALGAATALITIVLGAGCSKAPEAPTTEHTQKTFDSQIQSIQNNPNMPAEAKQRAIEGMKAQQNRNSPQAKTP